jgi:hypothetical protein
VPAATETANASTGNRSVADQAGNTSTVGPITGNRVDKKAPSISIGQPTAVNYQLNQAATASYSCGDAGSRLATCEGPVSSGGAINTSSPGTKTFAVTAIDAVGNTSTQSVTYTVQYQFSGFCNGSITRQPSIRARQAGRTQSSGG